MKHHGFHTASIWAKYVDGKLPARRTAVEFVCKPRPNGLWNIGRMRTGRWVIGVKEEPGKKPGVFIKAMMSKCTHFGSYLCAWLCLNLTGYAILKSVRLRSLPTQLNRNAVIFVIFMVRVEFQGPTGKNRLYIG
jgi:hypothetical protein